jgi:glycosyltransferase involved in cell wall biosynthesis
VNILVVEKTYPWPLTSGSHIRVANIVQALASIGEVDFFHISKAPPASPSPGSREPMARLAAMQRPPSGNRGFRRVAWLAGSRLPLEVAARDYSALHSAFRAWARPRYDLAWFGRAESYVALGDVVRAPSVLDLDDLRDHRIAGSLQLNEDDSPPGGGSPLNTVFHRWAWRIQADVNLRRWRALQRRIASSVAAVSVCSDVDRERIRAENAVIIPNGYPPPERPVGKPEIGEPPTLVLPALFRYRPNVDAARFLVEEILPRVRTRFPHARVRLVGNYDHRIADLSDTDGVTLTGFVPDITAELARADIIVVPVRFGSGTRVKILEAFAHRIPVVSTTVGCEGLEVRDREHLLVADDAETIAAACARLLEDVSLRATVSAAAHDLYWRRYRWDAVASTIVELASRIAGLAAEGAGRPSSRGEAHRVDDLTVPVARRQTEER